MSRIRLPISIILLCTCGFAGSEEFSANVIAVLDGDTVLVKRANGPVKIRLAEIDAPEKAQNFGESSRRSLADMVLGKQVVVSGKALDQYGRVLAHIGLGGMDVNAEQVRRGMAWEYSHFHSNRFLVALQEEARRVPRGLWALENPVPPWEWRKAHPDAVGGQLRPAVPVEVGLPTEPISGYICGSKNYCHEMVSCGEARHYLTRCGVRTLDGNGDGVPCEKLCAADGATSRIKN